MSLYVATLTVVALAAFVVGFMSSRFDLSMMTEFFLAGLVIGMVAMGVLQGRREPERLIFSHPAGVDVSVYNDLDPQDSKCEVIFEPRPDPPENR